jgi:hypothetical protein
MLEGTEIAKLMRICGTKHGDLENGLFGFAVLE